MTQSHSSNVTPPEGNLRREDSDIAVGLASRRAAVSDAELERHIASLGQLSEKAMAEGDPTSARLWSASMVHAIAQRSPEQLARMARVIDEGIDYFQIQAERARRMAQARGLAQ